MYVFILYLNSVGAYILARSEYVFLHKILFPLIRQSVEKLAASGNTMIPLSWTIKAILVVQIYLGSITTVSSVHLTSEELLLSRIEGSVEFHFGLEQCQAGSIPSLGHYPHTPPLSVLSDHKCFYTSGIGLGVGHGSSIEQEIASDVLGGAVSVEQSSSLLESLSFGDAFGSNLTSYAATSHMVTTPTSLARLEVLDRHMTVEMVLYSALFGEELPSVQTSLAVLDLLSLGQTDPTGACDFSVKVQFHLESGKCLFCCPAFAFATLHSYSPSNETPPLTSPTNCPFHLTLPGV